MFQKKYLNIENLRPGVNGALFLSGGEAVAKKKAGVEDGNVRPKKIRNYCPGSVM